MNSQSFLILFLQSLCMNSQSFLILFLQNIHQNSSGEHVRHTTYSSPKCCRYCLHLLSRHVHCGSLRVYTLFFSCKSKSAKKKLYPVWSWPVKNILLSYLLYKNVCLISNSAESWTVHLLECKTIDIQTRLKLKQKLKINIKQHTTVKKLIVHTWYTCIRFWEHTHTEWPTHTISVCVCVWSLVCMVGVIFVHIDMVYVLWVFFFMLSWMFQHDYLDTWCFEYFIYMHAFCICTCSSQLSMFHVERRFRNMLTIIIITNH